MKKKKVFSSLIVMILLSISFTSAYASVKTSRNKEIAKNEVKYESFNGIVKEINASSSEKDTKYVLVEDKEGAQVNFIVNKDTYLVNNDKINIGSEFTGYYNANLPTIMIYPAQYKAEVVLIKNAVHNFKVDLFDKDLISADRLLKLNIGKDTEVVKEDGTKYTGELSNHKLVVYYDFMTKSLPAQTTPVKVVVLSDTILPDDENRSYYGAFTGTVTKITDLGKGSFKIDLKSQDEEEATFTVSDETYRTNEEKIEIGSIVTGYYDAKLMTIMLYPMQYIAEVIDVVKADYNVKVDYFDRKLVSSDGKLKIHIDSNIPVINEDGTVYKGRPIKKNLVVIYGNSTKSIPAQTHPIKIVVLSDK